MIPFFDARLDTGWATLGSRTSDEDYGGVLKMLGKPLMDCFRAFYADTALCGGRIGTVCGLEFFGADHVLFASDAPFGAEGGASYIRETMKVIAGLDISAADKEKICYRNAQALFKLAWRSAPSPVFSPSDVAGKAIAKRAEANAANDNFAAAVPYTGLTDATLGLRMHGNNRIWIMVRNRAAMHGKGDSGSVR